MNASHLTTLLDATLVGYNRISLINLREYLVVSLDLPLHQKSHSLWLRRGTVLSALFRCSQVLAAFEPVSAAFCKFEVQVYCTNKSVKCARCYHKRNGSRIMFNLLKLVAITGALRVASSHTSLTAAEATSLDERATGYVNAVYFTSWHVLINKCRGCF